MCMLKHDMIYDIENKKHSCHKTKVKQLKVDIRISDIIKYLIYRVSK